MSPRTRTTITASILLAACLAGSIFFLTRVDAMRTTATLDEVLFINSPKWVKRLSLGYDGLMADIYWTRAVQYFGSRHQAQAKSFNALAPLLDITTTLDPKLLVAYEFGANFLSPNPPFGAAQPKQAIALVEKGIQANPNAWKLYYELGFIYYMELKDYRQAAEAFERGSQVPGAHPFMKILAANMAQHAGDMQMARAVWTTTYESSQDKYIRGNAVAHLRALQVEEDVTRIQDAVTAYGKKTGELPPNMIALAKAGLLPGIPIDPDGHPYKLTSEGRVELQSPEDFPFATKGLPLGYKARAPRDLNQAVN